MFVEAAADLRVIDLGRMAYAEALALQRRLNDAVCRGDEPPTLLLLEHDPVITITPRKGATDHLLASRDRLRRLGIDVQETDRGGDITYHGPGQLVAYPIVRLGPLGLNLGRYMRMLEQVVIDTLAHFRIEAHREEGATGVWVDQRVRGSGFGVQDKHRPEPRTPNPEPRTAKLCALGVRVRRNTTMHGLALNVTTDLSHFDTIVPCGLTGRGVTSLAELLGDAAPTMARVKSRLAGVFRDTLLTPRAAAV